MIEQNDSSMRQTKNGWKYLSFVLIGILAFGVTVATLPQAMAKPPADGTGDQMMMIIQNIQDVLVGIDGQGHCVTIDENRDDILDKYEISPRPFSGVNYSGCDLFDVELNNLLLSSSNLSGARLTFANLSGSTLERSDLSYADLIDADLSGADLGDANLSGADLTIADLSGARLVDANFTDANVDFTNFQDAFLDGADFTGCTGTPIGTPASGSLPVCS